MTRLDIDSRDTIMYSEKFALLYSGIQYWEEIFKAVLMFFPFMDFNFYILYLDMFCRSVCELQEDCSSFVSGPVLTSKFDCSS